MYAKESAALQRIEDETKDRIPPGAPDKKIFMRLMICKLLKIARDLLYLKSLSLVTLKESAV